MDYELRLLGQMFVSSKRDGSGQRRIAFARTLYGSQHGMAGGQKNEFDLAQQQLGGMADSMLARRNGRTIKEVVAMRENRRVRSPTPPRHRTAREIRLRSLAPICHRQIVSE